MKRNIITLYENTDMKKIVNRYTGKSYHHRDYSKPIKTVEFFQNDYNYTEMKEIDKKSKNRQVLGIYMLYNSLHMFPHSPVYLGMSKKNVYERVLIHMQRRDRKTKHIDIEYCRIFTNISPNDIRAIEKIFINQYTPLLNIQHNKMYYYHYFH